MTRQYEDFRYTIYITDDQVDCGEFSYELVYEGPDHIEGSWFTHDKDTKLMSFNMGMLEAPFLG